MSVYTNVNTYLFIIHLYEIKHVYELVCVYICAFVSQPCFKYTHLYIDTSIYIMYCRVYRWRWPHSRRFLIAVLITLSD